MLTCSPSVGICLFSNNLILGRETSKAESKTTIRQVEGVAFVVDDLQINACNLFTCAIRLRFCLWSSLTLWRRFLFSSEPRFTLKMCVHFTFNCKKTNDGFYYLSSNPSTYSFFLFLESCAEILLRIFLLILFSSLSSFLVKG